jgi:hypothetical protein
MAEKVYGLYHDYPSNITQFRTFLARTYEILEDTRKKAKCSPCCSRLDLSLQCNLPLIGDGSNPGTDIEIVASSLFVIDSIVTTPFCESEVVVTNFSYPPLWSSQFPCHG